MRVPGLLFQLEQCPFAVDAPAVTAHFSVFAHDTVARNRDCNRIRGTRAGHGSGRGGTSDGFCDLAVGLRYAEWE
jgi:hypothetical protein